MSPTDGEGETAQDVVLTDQLSKWALHDSFLSDMNIFVWIEMKWYNLNILKPGHVTSELLFKSLGTAVSSSFRLIILQKSF